MKPLAYHTRRVLDLHSFLDCFENVTFSGERDGKSQYAAKCPAHETSHQSLGIATTRDGRYLIHCHAGCAAGDVLAAVGLSLGDLYPDGCLAERLAPKREGLRERDRRNLLMICDEDRKAGKRISEHDKRKERDAWMASRGV